MPRFISRSFPWIGLILLGAFLVRLPAVFYGLPYHLIGDEEASVYGALQMIQLHTLLPVLNPGAFTVLYEPPLLAYIYTIFFVPVIAGMYVLSGFPTTHAFAAMITLDPSILWYVGRTIGILFSLGTIYIVYRLGWSLTRSRMAGLLSALFIATSYLSTTIASTTRQWTPGTFTSILALYFVWRAFESGAQRRTRWLIASGVALGCSFGFSYLPFYVLTIAAIIIYFSWVQNDFVNSIRTILINGLYAGVPFLLCVALFFGVDPYPFNTQVTHHVVSSALKTPWNFITYYINSLWNFETPLFVGSVIGITMLIYKRYYKFLIIIALFFVSVATPMYIFLPNIDRYLVALLPVFSLISGYGIYELIHLFPATQRRNALLASVSLLLVYGVILFGRYDFLLLQNDTRIHAKEWIESNIPSHSVVILNSDADRMRLRGTSESIAEQGRISPNSLRAPDRVLLADNQYATHPFTLFSLHNASVDEQKELVTAAVSQSTSTKYLIEDAWAGTTTDSMILNKTLVKEFVGSRAIPNLEGLVIGGDTSYRIRKHILYLLYAVPMLGPGVSIYNIGTTTTKAP